MVTHADHDDISAVGRGAGVETFLRAYAPARLIVGYLISDIRGAPVAGWADLNYPSGPTPISISCHGLQVESFSQREAKTISLRETRATLPQCSGALGVRSGHRFDLQSVAEQHGARYIPVGAPEAHFLGNLRPIGRTDAGTIKNTLHTLRSLFSL